MKKTYMEPLMSVVTVNMKGALLLEASNPRTQTLSIDGDVIEETDQIGARQHRSIWDDPEE